MLGLFQRKDRLIVHGEAPYNAEPPLDRLRAAYRAISPRAAAGVDGQTWATYGQDLEDNLRDLHDRLQSGRYRASPSRRAYIPSRGYRERGMVGDGGRGTAGSIGVAVAR